MHQSTLGLAALLMLGGTVIAQAQEGRGDRLPDAGQSLESGVEIGGGAGPRGGEGLSGDGSRDEGPSAESRRGRADRAEGPPPDARKGVPNGERSGAVRKDRPDRSAQDKPRAGKSRAVKEPDSQTISKMTSDEKATDRKTAKDRTAKDRAETPDKSPGRSAEDGKDKGAKRKSADERSGRDAGTDARDAVKDQAADRDRKAGSSIQAEGDRKPPEDVRKADLSGERRERVGSAFRESRDVKHRTDVNIDISVGRRLPHDWDFVPVPVAVVEVVPEYRGYVFAYVEDEYVICDPVTYEVVAVLPASGGGARYAGGGGSAERCSTSLTLSEDERADIVRSIQITDEVDVSDITVGWAVPGNIELRTFPEPIVLRNGELAACRYFLSDDQIAIVDPAEETVVLLIDQEE